MNYFYLDSFGYGGKREKIPLLPIATFYTIDEYACIEIYADLTFKIGKRSLDQNQPYSVVSTGNAGYNYLDIEAEDIENIMKNVYRDRDLKIDINAPIFKIKNTAFVSDLYSINNIVDYLNSKIFERNHIQSAYDNACSDAWK